MFRGCRSPAYYDGTVTILIVEDDAEMRRMIRSLVARLAQDIYECGDGSAAVAAYAEHRPDWVLMDVKLPGLDGIEATRRIRESFPEARVVIVTAYEDAELRKAAERAGAREYLSKRNLVPLLALLR